MVETKLGRTSCVFPFKIECYLMNGVNVTMRNHAVVPYRVNDLIFNTVCMDKDIVVPYIYLSREAYESLKRKMYGKTIDEKNKQEVEFIYNQFECHNEKDELVNVRELLVIKKDGNNLYRLLGYYRLGKCLVCINNSILHAIRQFLIKYQINMNDPLEFGMPKIFQGSVLYIQ